MSGPPDSKPVAPGGFDPNFINSMLPDGTILRFPKDTPPEVVDRMFKEQLGQYLQQQGPKPPEVGTGKAAAIGGTQGLTFNLGDEIAAGIGATVGRPGGGDIAGENWGERYDNALTEARGVQHAAQNQHPVAFGAGKVAGAVLPAVIAPEAFGANYVAAAPTLLSAAGRGALTSGAYGALTGFNEGEGGAPDRVISAGKGGAIGAAAGAVISPLIKGASNLINGPAPAAAPASSIAKDAADASYKAFDKESVVLAPEALKKLNDTIRSDLAEWGIDDALQPGATRLLTKLNDLSGSGENVTLKGIEMLRKVAGRVNNPQNAADAEAARKIIDHIDDFMENLKPDEVVMGDASKAVEALKEARANWASFRKADLIETAITKAQDRASSTGTGGNVVNAIRQNLRQILDNPKLSRGFSSDEIDAIRQVVRGGKMENIARLASVFAPSRGGVNAWMATLASIIPGGQILPAIGEGAHAAAQKMTGDAAKALPGMILSRAPAAASMPTLPAYSEAVARALGGAQTAANTGGRAWADALLRSTRAPQ